MIEQKINTSFFTADLDELSNEEQMLIKKAQNIFGLPKEVKLEKARIIYTGRLFPLKTTVFL